ncbi:MAG: CotH kinase family protein [Planctomycetes bacterium]|nr:CotH kinase family protein [Planctomycetota bacterium]
MKHRIALILSLFPLAALAAPAAQAQVVINEFVASNVDGLRDEDRDTSDWIELVNQGPLPVNLQGYGLSDDPLDPLRWTFPDLTLLPQQHLVVFASGKDRSSYANEYTTVVDHQFSWRYFEGVAEPPTGWWQPGFNDSAWAVGPSGFGYGDNDDSTIVSSPTVYVRHGFTLTQAQIDGLVEAYLHVDFDDAFVAFLNGVEVARDNIGQPGDHPAYNATANSHHEAALYRGKDLEPVPAPELAGLLQVGGNVLALQVHNRQLGDNDLSLIPFLSLASSVGSPTGGGHPPELLFPESVLHANFKLDAAGESLSLSDPGGAVLDQHDTGLMKVDVSRGRGPSGGPGLLYFQAPTPAAANTSLGFPAISEPVTMSPEGGWSAGPVSVSLSHPAPGATIRYTFDAREPTPSDPAYGGPIQVAGPIKVLRARAFESGKWPSDVATATFAQGVTAKLPVFSLVTDPPNLWDPQTGIYHGSIFGGNHWKDWERPVHVEMFETNGSVPLRFDAGMKIHGGFSRTFPQKSLRLIPRDGYGIDSIDYPFFGPEAPQSFRRLVLRNAGNDWCEGHLRDGVVHRMMAGEDLEVMLFSPALVLLNGDYWGIHNVRERQDRYFLETHRGVDPDELDLLELNQEVVEGDNVHYQAMLDFIGANDLGIEANYRHVQTLMDTENFATYAALQVYVANTDWPGNNIKYWRPRTPEGRWRWMLYDTDFGLGLENPPSHNTLAFATNPNGGIFNPSWATFLFRKLLESPLFARSFINRYADYLNTRFRPDQTLPVATEVARSIQAEIGPHMQRWNRSVQTWRRNLGEIRDFLNQRPQFAASHIIQKFNLAGSYQLDLDVQPPGAGSIRLTAIDVDGPWTGSYFLGVPVELTAVPKLGWEFVDWSDPGLPATATVDIDPFGNYSLSANFQPGGPAAVINEINYNSAASFDPGDWVELHNASDSPLDLSNWSFHDEASAFTIPAGAVVPPRGYLVLCADLVTFQGLFPGVANAIGDLGFSFKGSGELLQLRKPDGSLFDEVFYDDEAPWPTEPDGNGPTLELYLPTLDNALAASWRASLGTGGTPGSKNSVTP